MTGPGTATPASIERIRGRIEPVLRRAVDGIANQHMRRIASYQLGWCAADGTPTPDGGGKTIRPTLAVLSAEAVGDSGETALAPGAALELVHNFSLLHDDIMDRDVERRHRPTGWVAFGDGQAILAGNAMLTAAIELVTAAGEPGRRALPALLSTVQELISGQSDDLLLEGRGGVELDEVLHMEAGKTAALLACATSIGARAAGAPAATVDGLARFGYEMGMAFQIVDDILGVTGDPSITGKSASSDVRAGKNSVPIAAALRAGRPESSRLADLLAAGAPETDTDVILATKLIEEAGGLQYASAEAERRLSAALEALHALELPGHAAATELEVVARYIVSRDR